MKRSGKVLIAAAVVAALLAGAFWLGGNDPGSRGWNIAPAEMPALSEPVPGEEAAPTAGREAPETPAAAAPQGTLTGTPETPDEPSLPTGPEEPPEALPITPEEPPESVPAGPEEPPMPTQPTEESVPGPGPEEGAMSCTVAIRCDTVLSNADWLPEEKAELVPADGCLLAAVEVSFEAGESAFDVLLRVTGDRGLHMEYMNTPLTDGVYIEGIGNLYEFDCGALSGWMYRVNGWFPNYSCSGYALSDGDVVEWVYSCDLGADVGGAGAWGQQGG